MARYAYKVILQWAPHSPTGQFMKHDEYSDEIRLDMMTDVQRQLATIAAENAPYFEGNLYQEMFVGGGGNSMVSIDLATVEPGDPYGPQQGEEGFHSPPAAIDGGKYYSLRDWVIGMGFDEEAVYPIAKTLNYTGTPYLAMADAAMQNILTEEGEKATRYMFSKLGFGYS